ncbi:signal peptidase complex catalytic subunit SEC11C-like [Haliotis cracherodii]|uniref:signal peptidase complex catalytic subunit SEC11C-like n=1 Tax=Haliotis cracherodii TaxID=6455 RepID=UPI0039E7587C
MLTSTADLLPNVDVLLFMLTPVMLLKGLMVWSDCNILVLVVASGDLHQTILARGDLLFLTNYKEEPIRVGEIVVFKVEGRDIPIVHRVLKVHEKSWCGNVLEQSFQRLESLSRQQ